MNCCCCHIIVRHFSLWSPSLLLGYCDFSDFDCYNNIKTQCSF